MNFEEAIADFDPSGFRAFEHEAETQREETLHRYPREHWAELTLEQYAQGQAGNPDNYCRWIERQTDQMGSIRGGSARKLVVYKHSNKAGWYFPPAYADEREAWEAVRGQFLEAFERAEAGRWSELDGLEPLTRGPALLAKTLWVYFPDELLPITSSANLRHFLNLVGRADAAADQSLGTIALNRALLHALRAHDALADVSTKVLERLLYSRFSPFEGRVVKIAPGPEAAYWDDCTEHGYICVGWDEVGDLRAFESKDAFLAAFRDAFDYSTESKHTEKADELWLLLDLAVGERIVANRGKSEVLAVGTVESPGYVWDDTRAEYKHTVRVKWDEDYAKPIPPQPYWAFKTVLPLSADVKALVLDGTDPGSDPVQEEPAIFARLEAALERKGQAILYGPPGTGKTWHTKQFARAWLARKNGEDDPGETLEWVTFHPSYAYEDFVEGFRPALADEGSQLRLEDGVFKRLCQTAAAAPDRTFLLVIDEINRANVTKVFGELITLIEKDKREDYSARLPYSKRKLVIPKNLFVLGTMNTADRSIKMLDTALRRRFGFVELMPDPSLLPTQIGGVALDVLVTRLNARVAEQAGREKQIGHAFFLSHGQPISEEDEFAQVFRDEIVPLLQEYAADDYDELAEYLGPRIVDRQALTLDTEVLSDASRLLGALEEHLLGGQTDA